MYRVRVPAGWTPYPGATAVHLDPDIEFAVGEGRGIAIRVIAVDGQRHAACAGTKFPFALDTQGAVIGGRAILDDHTVLAAAGARREDVEVPLRVAEVIAATHAGRDVEDDGGGASKQLRRPSPTR
jgi:hypothetical protein